MRVECCDCFIAGANAFALDTRSKRQWESKPMSVETAEAFKQACRDYGFGPEHILPHGSYLINLASAKPELLEKSYAAFVDELKRCEMLGIRSGWCSMPLLQAAWSTF